MCNHVGLIRKKYPPFILTIIRFLKGENAILFLNDN